MKYEFWIDERGVEGGEKSVQCRYVAVKYSGIVKNTASDELKAKLKKHPI